MQKLGYNIYVKNMKNYKLRLLLFGLDKTETAGNASNKRFPPLVLPFLFSDC